MISVRFIFWVLTTLGCLSLTAVNAWQSAARSSCTKTSTPQHHGTAGHLGLIHPVERRQFLFQIVTTTATISTLTTTTFPQMAIASSTALSTEAARNQWKQALTTMDALLKDWSTVATSGDVIRTQLGTQGTVSPLFQIDKVLNVLRDDADDFIEFTETSEEFQLALSRADSMAYSANFAGGSGKPTPPAVYIEKSKTEVIELIRIAKKLNSLL